MFPLSCLFMVTSKVTVLRLKSQLPILNRHGANSDFSSICFGEFYFLMVLPIFSNGLISWKEIPVVVPRPHPHPHHLFLFPVGATLGFSFLSFHFDSLGPLFLVRETVFSSNNQLLIWGLFSAFSLFFITSPYCLLPV